MTPETGDWELQGIPGQAGQGRDYLIALTRSSTNRGISLGTGTAKAGHLPATGAGDQAL